MTDDDSTFEVELADVDASREIARAVSVRHAIARKFVLRARRRNPDASPAEVIRVLERQYVAAITTAGGVVTAAAIVADVGIALIPGVGAAAAGAKSASRQAAKHAGKQAAKAVAKQVARGAAVTGARRVAALLPAGDEQLQFEITAIFGLALADIHGKELDKDQAHALVYGLSNGRVSQQQIALMAADIARPGTDLAVAGAAAGGAVGVGQAIAAGRGDWGHWANTLADLLPGSAAQSLVGTIQTGRLDTVRQNLSGKQQAAVEYGVGALAGGVTRFLFGREVVEAARLAFADAPDVFPAHLAVPVTDDGAESNRALAALEDAAKTAGGAVAAAAGAVSRPFRRVDLDGDGIPDEPQALTAIKGVGGAAASLFKSRKPGRHAAGHVQPQTEE
ncbi:hypothetical protein ACQP00_36125 [Dactylosporangium sp. CS-047395]|uniref:hypothetical protein n=1 Tax=Dactylosporangium sp. CS-047395 TaxID=3239936 RepID=UPI003D94A256